MRAAPSPIRVPSGAGARAWLVTRLTGLWWCSYRRHSVAEGRLATLFTAELDEGEELDEETMQLLQEMREQEVWAQWRRRRLADGIMVR